MSRREWTAVLCAVAAIGFVLAFRWQLPVDAAVLRAVQGLRSCDLVRHLPWIDAAVRGVLAALAAAALRSREARSLAPRLAATAVAGAVASEILKTAFERMRPSESPGDLSGNSFPSGHAMNTTLAAFAIAELAGAAGWPRPARRAAVLLAATCVLVEAACRVVGGHHWTSDLPPSVLLGAAWMLGVPPAVGKLPAATTVAAATVAAAYGIATDLVPALRAHLPSVLERSRLAEIDRVELGEPSPRVEGPWSHGWREPIGGVSWLAGTRGTVELRGEGSILWMTLRPPGDPEGVHECAEIRVSVDGWEGPRFALLEGWRDYAIRLPPAVAASARKRVRLAIAGGPSVRGRLAVHELRLGPE